jgi:hypothetical protein
MVNIQAIKTKFVDYPNILAHIEMLEKYGADESAIEGLKRFEIATVDHAAGTTSIDARGEHITVSLQELDDMLKWAHIGMARVAKGLPPY